MSFRGNSKENNLILLLGNLFYSFCKFFKKIIIKIEKKMLSVRKFYFFMYILQSFPGNSNENKLILLLDNLHLIFYKFIFK